MKILNDIEFKTDRGTVLLEKGDNIKVLNNLNEGTSDLLDIKKFLKTALLLVDTDTHRAKQLLKVTIDILDNFEL